MRNQEQDSAGGSFDRWAFVAIIMLAICTFLVRCIHLLDTEYYYIISHDSYFFHHLAEGIISGDGPITASGGEYSLHSGLAYPLAYIAKVLGGEGSLDFVCMYFPPVLGIVGMVIIYLAGTKIYSKKAGLIAAFVWAFASYTIYTTAAGFLDRDGLSMLLIMSGAFLFYIYRDWHYFIGGKDVGWLIVGLGVLAIEVILYLEWVIAGKILLLILLASYIFIRLLEAYSSRLDTEKSITRRISMAIGEVSWRPIAVIVIGNIIWEIIERSTSNSMGPLLRIAGSEGTGVVGKGTNVQELMGSSPIEIFLYFNFLIIPIGFAFYLITKKRHHGLIFVSVWFILFILLSMFAGRLLIFAIPPACILAGIGLIFLWEWASAGRNKILKKGAVTSLPLLAALIGISLASSLGWQMAPDRTWQDAMAFLREETPQEAIIMSEWNWGYWILDLGEHRPLVDNGNHPKDLLKDIGLVYCATDTKQAVDIMNKHEADYLLFAGEDLDYAINIMQWAELDIDSDSFPDDCLVVRCINGEYQAEDGLEIVYSDFGEDTSVVILGLTSS